MFLSKGIRSISKGYIRDFTEVHDTEENIKSSVTLEMGNDNCMVKLLDSWPDSVSLNASISCEKIESSAFVERIENSKSLGKNSIYKSPIIDGNSGIKNHNSFCSKVTIFFENSGEYITENERNIFFDRSFDDYVMDFEKKDNILFEKDFMTVGAPIIEKYVSALGEFLRDEGSSGKASLKIYPYGGFYEYGTHPKNIELCVFQTAADSKITSIIINQMTTLISHGINPFADQLLKSGTPFVGLKGIKEEQKTNLYDDIKNGLCTIALKDVTNGDSKSYKSSSLIHIQNTNLITINFIRNDTQ
ncbi:hypothetical protein FACS189449_06890 [Alphaproteobacteria bacterium]|nr:hypothetical protein FACS189449_06890 [Alphaproteobacteria bacterium]